MFPGNSSTAMDAYRDMSVGSAAPQQLVLMLFDGARAALAAAKGHLKRREIAAKGIAISKAISIIDGGLKASLDLTVGGDLAQNLHDLYTYMSRRLFYANLKNDLSALEEVAKLLEDLGGAWEKIATKPMPATAPATAPAAAPAAVAAPVSTAPAVAAPNTAKPAAAAPATATPRNRVAAAYGVF